MAATIDLAEARQRGVDYLVASSFMYERYFLGSQFKGQDAEIYQVHQQYVELFKHPYVEIRPSYKSFGFNNPVIRIVDIRPPQKAGELDQTHSTKPDAWARALPDYEPK